jgi:CBS domain-containing protein
MRERVMVMRASVRDVMTINVIRFREDAPFKGMADRLGEHRQNAFPILDDHGTVIGVVSDTDLLAKEALDGGQAVQGWPGGGTRCPELVKAVGLTAGDLMTTPPVTVWADDPVAHAARLMYAHDLRQLPVVDASGHLVGLVSRAAVLSVYSRPDEEIRNEITKGVLRDKLLGGPGRFTVTVTDGIVTVLGHPESIPAGREIVVEIEQIDGVVAVHNGG